MEKEHEAILIAATELVGRMGGKSFQVGWFDKPGEADTWWCVAVLPVLSNIISKGSGEPGYTTHETRLVFPADIDMSVLDEEECPLNQPGKGAPTPYEAADGLVRDLLHGGACKYCHRSTRAGEKRRTGANVCVWYRKNSRWRSSCGH